MPPPAFILSRGGPKNVWTSTIDEYSDSMCSLDKVVSVSTVYISFIRGREIAPTVDVHFFFQRPTPPPPNFDVLCYVFLGGFVEETPALTPIDQSRAPH